MGGGTDASWRCRRMRVITDSWVMTAMIRREPRRQKGHVAISRPKTRPSSLAQGQYGVPVYASSPSSPCWRGGGTDRPLQVAVRREAAPITHQMDPRQGDERGQLLQEFQRREPNAHGPVRPRMGEGVNEIAVGLCLEPLQGYGTTGSIADEAFQLIAPVRRDLGAGVHRKPLHAGTVGTCKRGHLARAAKARADAPYPLASPLPKSNALLHGGRHGARELKLVVEQGIIPRGHGGI